MNLEGDVNFRSRGGPAGRAAVVNFLGEGCSCEF